MTPIHSSHHMQRVPGTADYVDVTLCGEKYERGETQVVRTDSGRGDTGKPNPNANVTCLKCLECIARAGRAA